uniref:Pogo transposable element derived with ZNF domain a n=1 Tax=Takifugu rubripes TaxID=31033 RepID=A0A3B5K4G5_TAKRU
MDNKEDKAAVRVIPLPLQPVEPASRSSSRVKECSSAPLSFMVNGQLMPLLSTGAELKLCSHPGRSASGFNTVQDLIPVENAHHTCGTTVQTPPSLAHSTPVITAVVSGEAAERVFNKHSVNEPVSGERTQAAPISPDSHHPAAPAKLPLQGNLEPVSPPDCQICRSQYKLIAELRGFMCLCSPALADSLNLLKKRKKQYLRKRRRTERYKALRTDRGAQTVGKVCKTRPRLEHGASDNKSPSPVISTTHKMPDDVEPEQLSRSALPFQHDQDEPLHKPQGKLVIMVEDFYYGSTPQPPVTSQQSEQLECAGPFDCIHCPKALYNNITLMNHMHEHVSNMSLPGGSSEGRRPTCPHCFRCYLSPFQLQSHIEAVHQPAEQPAGKCKICELTFANEPAFLQHMKYTHRPGEMPYVCQVCDFRSSFYSDLCFHFEQFHANTKHFLCRYCLRVLHNSTCYQQHFSIHQMKHTYTCDKCRLHFLFIKERLEHVRLHHRTHLQPAQLSGIKPGTKVTVRTYSAIRTPEDKKGSQKMDHCKVVHVDLPSPTPEAPKRRAVETLGPLLFSLNQASEEDHLSASSQRCLECLSSFRDFRSHFPSLVHCSLCRFNTCCSVAYANHMISNHAISRKKPPYTSVFQANPRLLQTLKCTVCLVTTRRGDVMANHLTERPDHHCVVLTHTEVSVNGGNITGAQLAETCSGSPSSKLMSGSFIPFHLLSSHQSSTQLSVKMLPAPLRFSSSPAMTVKFLGPQPDGSPLCSFKQRIVCSALIHGFSQASRSYQTPPHKIHSWIQQKERQQSETWYWSTEKLAEWVLIQREQQLTVSEETLMQMAEEALGETDATSCYNWVIDFLLRHKLSVNPLPVDRGHHPCGRLPTDIVANSRAFVERLSPQIRSKAPPLVATMDELPIFINMDHFRNQNPSAFQLSGRVSDEPVFNVVLTALVDGTLLPPLLLFKGTSCSIPEGFPDNVLLEARPEGFTDQDCQQIWMDKVWRPHTSAHGSSSHLLIADIHRGHLAEEFRQNLASVCTNIFFIPSGCSSCVQPLDVCVTPVLHDFMQARWSQLVSQGGLDGLGLDQLALTLACWLSEVSSILNTETHFLRKSFSCVSSLQSLEKDEASWMLRVLSKTLLQPLDSLVLQSAQSQLQVVLIVNPEGKKKKEQ